MVGAATDGAIAAAACGLSRASRASRHGSCNRGESCCNNGNTCRSGFANDTAVDGANANCHARSTGAAAG